MSLVNVRRDVTDVFYRYKMERLQTKIEGKGNGIKTVVTNLSSVAQSLARPGSYLIKYFGFELGAQTNIDPPDDRWIINGAHDSAKLQDYLDGFITKFVLCKKCKNPETVVQIKDGRIWLDCKACGQRSEVDLRLKLSGFILKNVPKKGKKDKAERKAARKAKQNGTANNKENGGDASGGDDDNSNGSAKDSGDRDNGTTNNGFAAAGGAASDDELTNASPAPGKVAVEDVEPKEVEWNVDMTEKAVKARQQALPDDFKQRMMLNGDDDDEDGEGGGYTVYDQLGEWIHEQAEAAGNVDDVDDVAIYVKARDLGIEAKHRTVVVLVQALFNEKILAQIPKRAVMLKRIITSERHERALLGGTERLVGSLLKEHPDMLDKVVKILHLYYNYDLVSEEVVTKWGTKASRKYTDLATSKKVRKAAEPFLTWLAEAEEEDDDEEEEEEEDEE
ncbi:Translation initiation factor IF2/IF5 [Niveomyces insectorum RCEF 264]|uniref:Translation initiation factor IF2/IF5 n=1 Tax=Niveomyces insectorum RCEF 264 TaxID=1081102 RepID=A0A167ZXD3_9HYPO|nr:Translation initiation factor IF2/IF5 [Niveomyces insectorum RCEF 264]